MPLKKKQNGRRIKRTVPAGQRAYLDVLSATQATSGDPVGPEQVVLSSQSIIERASASSRPNLIISPSSSPSLQGVEEEEKEGEEEETSLSPGISELNDVDQIPLRLSAIGRAQKHLETEKKELQEKSSQLETQKKALRLRFKQLEAEKKELHEKFMRLLQQK